LRCNEIRRRPTSAHLAGDDIVCGTYALRTRGSSRAASYLPHISLPLAHCASTRLMPLRAAWRSAQPRSLFACANVRTSRASHRATHCGGQTAIRTGIAAVIVVRCGARGAPGRDLIKHHLPKARARLCRFYRSISALLFLRAVLRRSRMAGQTRDSARNSVSSGIIWQ